MGVAAQDRVEHLGRVVRLDSGTWRAATWAIRFYERHGFSAVPEADVAPLLRRYWTVPDRQIETSVVLASPPFGAGEAARLIARS